MASRRMSVLTFFPTSDTLSCFRLILSYRLQSASNCKYLPNPSVWHIRPASSLENLVEIWFLKSAGIVVSEFAEIDFISWAGMAVGSAALSPLHFSLCLHKWVLEKNPLHWVHIASWLFSLRRRSLSVSGGPSLAAHCYTASCPIVWAFEIRSSLSRAFCGRGDNEIACLLDLVAIFVHSFQMSSKTRQKFAAKRARSCRLFLRHWV